MLVLSRLPQESVVLTVCGKRIEVYVSEVRGQKVRLAFKADRDVAINRSEVQETIDFNERASKEFVSGS